MDNGGKYEEYHERILKADGGISEKFLSKDEYKEANGFSVISAQGYELSCLGKIDEVSTKKKMMLDHSYGSFNSNLKEGRRDSVERTLDNTLMPGLPPLLVPNVSFSDKIFNQPCLSPQSQRRTSTVIRFSFKRKSCDGEEKTEYCKYALFCGTKFLILYFEVHSLMSIGNLFCVRCIKKILVSSQGRASNSIFCGREAKSRMLV